ncbi:MAG: hypothetical protein KKG75_05075 [Nanoarchaeota archaeon]|nr:hypothetical protein [Nanoarchaeota archaeon]
MEFTKKEIKNIIIASIILGIVFFLNEWRLTDHNLETGILSLIGLIILSAIIYLVHATSQKLMAQSVDAEIEFSLVQAKKIQTVIKEMPLPKYLFPIGPIITLLITVLSGGKFLFIALASFHHNISRYRRVGHKWTNIKEFEEAKIAFAGPLSNLILLAIFKILLPLSPQFLSKAVFISSTLAIFHLLPLPQFDGLKIVMGSRVLYIFAIVLAILTIFLINITSVFIALFLALIVAIAVSFYFLYRSNK